MLNHFRTLLVAVLFFAFSFGNISNSLGNTVKNVAGEVYQPAPGVVSEVYKNTENNTVIERTYQDDKTTVPQEVYLPKQKPVAIKPKPAPLVKPSIIWAATVQAGKIYAEVVSKKVVSSFPKGAMVQVIRDRELIDYQIIYNGKSGWVKGKMLKIPPDPATNTKQLNKQQLEDFVNDKAFVSTSLQLIWVDIDRQVTNIFTGKKGQWKLTKSIPVATGKNASPTIRGTFKVEGKGSGFTVNEKIKVVKYTQFSGPYKFHSVLLDKKGKVVDSTVSKRRSHGCIRMAIADATWLYNNIRLGSAVWIN